jgi:glycosyltransferase involved in cell wall biosynthesis
MKISIITPNYNYGRYLSDLINSVQSQDVDYELIICDGKSEDRSHEIISAFMRSNKSIKWISLKDINQSDALNMCLKEVTGEWVCWINSDEFLNAGALAKYIESIKRFQDSDVIYGDVIFCDESTLFKRLVGKHSFARNVLEGYGTYIQTSSMIIKTNKLGQIPDPIFDINLELIMDQDLFLKLSDHDFKFKYVPFAFGVFRIHSNQKTNLMEARIQREKSYLKNRYPRISLKRRRSSTFHHQILKLVEMSYFREILSLIRMKNKSMRWWIDI